MTNFNNAIETIGQAIFEEHGKNAPEEVKSLLNNLNNAYVLVQWPDSQDFMEEDWFEEEAIFCGGSEDKTGDSAYFIPLNRII